MEGSARFTGTDLQIAENIFLPIDYEGLSPNLKAKAKRELNESEEVLCNGIRKVKDLINEEGVLTCPTDDFIILFLRAKKFNVERSYKHLKEYSYQRHVCMNYYGFMLEDKIMPVFYNNICGVLPKRDSEGRAVVYFCANKWSSTGIDADDVLRAVQLLGHFVLMYPATQVSGICVIADMKVDSLEVLHLLFKYIRWALPNINTFPGRFQKIDAINTNILIRTLTSLVRPLIPSKISKRINFHGSNFEKLSDIYGPSILPEEFGGTLGSINEVSEKFLHKIKEYVPILQATNRYFTRGNTVPHPESKLELSGFYY